MLSFVYSVEAASGRTDTELDRRMAGFVVAFKLEKIRHDEREKRLAG